MGRGAMSDLVAQLHSDIESIMINEDLTPCERRSAIRQLLARYQLRQAWDEFLAVYVLCIRRCAPDSVADILTALLGGPEFAPFRTCGLGMEFVAMMMAAWYPRQNHGWSSDLSYQPFASLGMSGGRP